MLCLYESITEQEDRALARMFTSTTNQCTMTRERLSGPGGLRYLKQLLCCESDSVIREYLLKQHIPIIHAACSERKWCLEIQRERSKAHLGRIPVLEMRVLVLTP